MDRLILNLISKEKNLDTLNTKTNSTRTSQIVLASNAITPIIAYFFLNLEMNLPSFTWLLVILLISPSILSLYQQKWLKYGYWSSLLALFFTLFGTTADLWFNLLNNQNINLVNHLLALFTCLILTASLQMHTVIFQEENEFNEAQSIARIMRGPPLILSLIIAVILIDSTMIALNNTTIDFLIVIQSKILDRGIIPPLTILLFYWGLFLLLGKWWWINQQTKHKENSNLQQIYQQSKNKTAFFEYFWQQFESFYSIPKYINWAIPILGFIGTVLGISLATESLSELLGTTETNFSQLLSEALSPLGIAFDTTLIALTLSVILTLIQTLLYRWEEKQHIEFEQKHKSN